MGTYTQWRTAADRGDVARVTYVCGDQRVLVEEVAASIRAALTVSTLDLVTLRAGDAPPVEIWAAAMQHPLVPDTNRLIIVRGADRLTSWEPLQRWFDQARYLPRVYLLFIADTPDFPTVSDGPKPQPAPHIELIRGRRQGRAVRCGVPADEDALAWVRRRAGTLDQEMAYHLLRRVGGDLCAAAEVCDKLALFDGNPSRSTIDALAAHRPGVPFVDALIAGQKRQALLVLERMAEREAGSALALLISRLDLLAALWRLSRAGQSAREIQGLPAFLVRQYLPYAKDYDPRRCLYARRVLAVVDDVYRRGARVAVLEALVALW